MTDPCSNYHLPPYTHLVMEKCQRTGEKKHFFSSDFPFTNTLSHDIEYNSRLRVQKSNLAYMWCYMWCLEGSYLFNCWLSLGYQLGKIILHFEDGPTGLNWRSIVIARLVLLSLTHSKTPVIVPPFTRASLESTLIPPQTQTP